MRTTARPPQRLIDLACRLASRSPCAKSKRGVVAYRDAEISTVSGAEFDWTCGGWNGPPADGACLANDACKRDCPKRCVHAEMRALRHVPAMLRGEHVPAINHAPDVVLLHVELVEGTCDQVVGCDGPKCWQCSREILDCGYVHGIWLHEAPSRAEVTKTVEDALTSGQMLVRTDKAIEAYEHIVSLPKWRYYEARDFHRETCARLGIA